MTSEDNDPPMFPPSYNCWLFHAWAKWEPATAEAHAYQHRTCQRCGLRQYTQVSLGGSGR